MENNQRNSRKRLNSLILLVAFTAIMLIVSTYAWFSAQKNVTIGGLKGTVNVAEGLEISLDASNWSQEVDFSKYTAEQLKKMYEVMSPEGGQPYYTRPDGKGTSQIEGTLSGSAPEHNIIPTELLPVSTTGKTNDGIGQQDMNMYRGVNTDSIKLSEIIPTLKTTSGNTGYGDDAGDPLTSSHHDYPGYYAIDLFLRNSSSSTESGTTNRSDILQLNNNSVLKLTNTNSNSTGLQNTVRVAFAIYNATAAAATDTDSNSIVSGEEWNAQLPNMATSTYMTAAQQQILNAYKNQTIADVAIWEPNASDHVQYVVNNNNKVVFSDADGVLFGLPHNDVANKYDSFTATSSMRTYALTSTAVSTTMNNIYDWATPTTGLDAQVTLQTEKTSADDYRIAGGVKNLVSVTSDEALKYTLGNESGVTNFKMAKGTVCKVRMYVWLEGQDVDTINYASHGGGIYLDVGLLKDGALGS